MFSAPSAITRHMNAKLQWLVDLPTTNLRALVGIVLSVIYVTTLLFMDAIGHHASETVVWSLGTFILLQMGLDVTQFAVKRNTFQPTVTQVAQAAMATETSSGGSVKTTAASVQSTNRTGYDRRRG